MVDTIAGEDPITSLATHFEVYTTERKHGRLFRGETFESLSDTESLPVIISFLGQNTRYYA